MAPLESYLSRAACLLKIICEQVTSFSLDSRRCCALCSTEKMQIRTSTNIKASKGDIWPLLTQSRMDVPGCFCFGLPQPKSCELPSGTGEVGHERRCISDRGTVIQRIIEWSPPAKLTFEMVSTDHTWSSWVESLTEEFTLVETGEITHVTRRTTIKAMGFMSLIKEIGFYAGLKRVHLYVFKNWKVTAETG